MYRILLLFVSYMTCVLLLQAQDTSVMRSPVPYRFESGGDLRLLSDKPGAFPPNYRLVGSVGQTIIGNSGVSNGRLVIGGLLGSAFTSYPLAPVRLAIAENDTTFNVFPLTFTGHIPTRKTFQIENMSGKNLRIDSVVITAIQLDSVTECREFALVNANFPRTLLPNAKDEFIIEFTPGGKDTMDVSGERAAYVFIYADGLQNPSVRFAVGGPALVGYPIDEEEGVPAMKAYHGFAGYVRSRNGADSATTFTETLRFGIFEKSSQTLASGELKLIQESLQGNYTPKGRYSLENGVFSYTPHPDDKLPFEVEVQAGATKDTLLIEPFVVLPPENKQYGLRFTNPTYLPRGDDIEAYGFFGAENYGKSLKRVQGEALVEVSDAVLVGKNIDIRNGIANARGTSGGYNLNERNYRELLIVGETISLTGDLNVSGANVRIIARDITLQPNARINTNIGLVALDSVRLAELSTRANTEAGGNVFITAEKIELPSGQSLASRVTLNTSASVATFLDTSGIVASRQSPVWLHPSLLRVALAYSRDLYMQGFYAIADSTLHYYITRGFEFMQTPAFTALSDFQQQEYDQVIAEMQTMAGRIEAGLDYFGYPVGYVPGLSLEITTALYQKEIEYASQVAYLAYLMRKIDLNAAQLLSVRTLAINTLDGEIGGLIEEYGRLKNDIDSLISFGRKLEDSLEATKADFRRLEDQLIARANQIFQEREAARAEEARHAAKKAKRKRLVKSIINVALVAATFVPVGQPALAMAAKIARTAMAAREAVRNINWRKPFSIENIGHAMKVAQTWKNPGFNSVSDAIRAGSEFAGAVGLNERVTRFANTAAAIGDQVKNLKNIDFDNFLPGKITNIDSLKAFKERVKGTIDQVKPLVDSAKSAKSQVQDFYDRYKNSGLPEKFQAAINEVFPSEEPIVPRLPEGEVGVIFSELQAQEPRFGELMEKIYELAEEQNMVAHQTKLYMDRAAQVPNEVASATLSIIALAEQSAQIRSSIDPGALNFVYDMERRSYERMTKYRYLMAKAFEYRVLEPANFPIVDTMAGRIRNQFLRLDSTKLVGNTINVTPREVFDILKVVHQDPVKRMADTIINRANQGISSSSRTFQGNYVFTSEQLEKLSNGEKIVVNFDKRRDVFGFIDEDIRLDSITVLKFVARRKDGISSLGRIEVKTEHAGEGVVLRNGEAYRFRLYDTLSTSTDPNATIQRPFWLSSYNFLTNRSEDSREGSDYELIRFFAGEGKNVDVFARMPGVADYIVGVNDPGYSFVIDTLIFNVSGEKREQGGRRFVRLEARPVGGNEETADIIKPYFILTQNNTSFDGRGSFRRYFDREATVQLQAPLKVGQWKFDRWTSPSGALPVEFSEAQATNASVTISMSRNYDLIARYHAPVLDVQVATDSIDIEGVATTTVTLSSIGFFADKKTRNLQGDKRAYWRVIGRKPDNVQLDTLGNMTITNSSNGVADSLQVEVEYVDGEQIAWHKKTIYLAGKAPDVKILDVPMNLTSTKDTLPNRNWERLQVSWTQVPDAQRYKVQVALSPEFQNIIRDTVSVTTSMLFESLPTATTYRWRVRAENDTMVASGWAMNMNDITVSVEEPTDVVSSVSVYPNPAQKLLTVRYVGEVGEHVSMTLMDVTGRAVATLYKGTVAQKPLLSELNIAAMAQGAYFVVVQTAKGMQTVPITITR